MRGIGKKFIIVVLIGLFLFSVVQLGWAEKWQFGQFEGDERFEYKILWGEDEEKREVIYILDIKKSKKGEEVFEVTYTTKETLTKDELGTEPAFGLWAVYGISLSVLMNNPYYAFVSSQMDLKVGEKMNFFGTVILKVIGKEKIAGREGFVCQLFQPDEEDKMVGEWIIDPDLALPLRVKIFGDNELQGQIELVKYMQY
ncbi:unnamed protein product [marine sediment metagenome]|uniref:DUF3108 domain-containing protein n=1 Tax=marine sediment metagenome TaxID=412755 RepID=X1AQ05_9ZZZZ